MASAEIQPASGQVPFSAREMLQYFEELDELLIDAGVSAPLHLYVCGGAVIATKSDSRITNDVDVVSEGMTPELRRAAEALSRRHRGLRPDWLNDGAKLKRVNLPMEPERIYSGRLLIIDSAGDRRTPPVVASELLPRVRHRSAVRCATIVRKPLRPSAHLPEVASTEESQDLAAGDHEAEVAAFAFYAAGCDADELASVVEDRSPADT